MPSPKAVRYLSANLAQQIDEQLMSRSGAFSLDQLMELAGLSCAQALARSFPVHTHQRVLVCCGPGNQGGDGLVAARHLHHLNYRPTIFIPKPGKKDIYERLLKQCENLKIPVLKEVEELEQGLAMQDVIMDAIFGFSFKAPLRRPFDLILTHLRTSSLPIISVDIPSGWDVDSGRQTLETQADEETGEVAVVETFEPEVLISLTAPKKGVRDFKGQHWLGGRFVPDDLAEKFDLNIPEYKGLDHVVELPRTAIS